MPERIRVIQLVQHFALGGGTIQAMVLAERLPRDRYEVIVAAGPTVGPEGTLREEMQRRGIEVVTVPHLMRSPHPLHDTRAVLSLRHLIREVRPTIVDCHGSKPRFLLPIAARLAPVPIRVAHIAGWEWEATRGGIMATVLPRVARLTSGAWDAFIPCSHATGRQGIDRGIGARERYHMVWPPVDLDAFVPDDTGRVRQEVREELGIGPEELMVISVLRIARQKRPLDLIELAALVAAERPDMRLVLVGGGVMEEEVRAAIAERGMQDRVLLLKPRRDVARLMNAADVFALLSAWEAFGIVFAEAAAVGLPSVAARVGGIVEAVADGDSGLLVEPGDVPGAAAAVLRIASDADLAARLREGGVRHARQFSTERFVAETAAVYEKLLADKGVG